jgi:hypothetical protein
MPRDLPVGNGKLLINFDSTYSLRDLYYPHVGQETPTDGHLNRFGVWVDGEFSWFHDNDWQCDLAYERESLVTCVTCINERLGLELVCAVHVTRVDVRNHRGRARKVRLFQHLDLTSATPQPSLPSWPSVTGRKPKAVARWPGSICTIASAGTSR